MDKNEQKDDRKEKSKSVVEMIQDQSDQQKQEMIDMLEGKRNDEIDEKLDIELLIADIASNPSKLEDILRDYYKEINDYFDQECLKKELQALEGISCHNLALKYYHNGLRIKTILLNEQEFHQMRSIQFGNVKGLTDEMVIKCL